MRTNIEIDPELMAEAMRVGGKPTKRETVEEALRTFVRLERQQGIRRLRGKINWVGDLDAMRLD
jgi:Arc/MetJ family transcription regulator